MSLPSRIYFKIDLTLRKCFVTYYGTAQACDGGLAEGAFDWAAKNGGVALESNIPYRGGYHPSAIQSMKRCMLLAWWHMRSFTDMGGASWTRARRFLHYFGRKEWQGPQ